MNDKIGDGGLLAAGILLISLYAVGVVIGALAIYLGCRYLFSALSTVIPLNETEIIILSALSSYIFLKGISYGIWERRRRTTVNS